MRHKQLPSKGESKIRTWLSTNGIAFEMEKEFEDLINPATGASLRFDFWLTNLNTAIEFDGFHHMSPESSFHEGSHQKFIGQKIRDRTKDKWCKENGARLLRISCADYDKVYRILSKNFSLATKSINEQTGQNISPFKALLSEDVLE